MKFPHTLEYKIFDAQERKNHYLLFLPQAPSLFRIDKVIKDILAVGKRANGDELIDELSVTYEASDIKEAIDELELLKNRGFLSINRMEDHFLRPVRKDGFRLLELHLSNDCNLACSYCFAKGGGYGLNLCAKRMDWDTARIAIDWFLGPHKDKKEALSIQFFGGEPLLNIEVLEKSLNYIQTKIESGHYSFIQPTIFTNGTLFTERAIKVLVKYKCIPWVSLDASSKGHNKNRPYKDGRPSYGDVISGIKRLKAMAPSLPVVMSPTLGKEDDINNIFEWSEKLELGNINIKFQFSLYDQKAVSGEDFDAFLERIEKGMNKLYYFSLRKGKAFEFLTDHMFYYLHAGGVAYAGCGAGKNRVAVNAEGQIFVCSVGMGRGAELGHVSSGVQPELQNKVNAMYNRLHNRVSDCINCWARKLCSGLCVLNIDKASSVRGTNRVCDFMRLLYEFCLKSYASLEQDDAYKIFGANETTEAILKKIALLYNLRDLRNSTLRHIKHISPVVNFIDS